MHSQFYTQSKVAFGFYDEVFSFFLGEALGEVSKCFIS